MSSTPSDIKLNLFLTALTIVVGILTAAGPVYTAYDLHNRGESPEKKLVLQHWSTVNPMRDLSGLEKDINLALTIEGKTVNNLTIAHDLLHNTGSAPIEPKDFFENLTINVAPPWYIISVENAKDLPGDLKLRWKRVSDTQFEADPALINPDDHIMTVIYLTNTKFGNSPSPAKPPEPTIEWNTRITNLRALSIYNDKDDRFTQPGMKYFPFDVRLEGFALLFTIIAALIFQALYFALIARAGLFGSGWVSISLMLTTTLLSFAAAESSATYLFPTIFTKVNPSYGLNFSIILVHSVCITLLWLSPYRGRRTAR